MPRNVRVLKLGTVCRDRATRLEGTLILWIYHIGGAVDYIFQPRGLNKKCEPIDRRFVQEAQLEITTKDFETVTMPIEILGSTVTDKASGFTGMAISLIYHINGCFHVEIQPSGTVPDENIPIRSCEFDLRRCSGEKILELSPPKLNRDIEQKPSPTDHPTRTPPPTTSNTRR